MASDAFQKLKSTVNRGITTISVKTSSSLEKSKIKTHIESLQRDIEKEFLYVGESAYKTWTNNENDYSGLQVNFETIQKKYKEIEELYAELAAIDERDNQILGNSAEITAKCVCKNCGAQYENPVNFCRKCGTKIEN